MHETKRKHASRGIFAKNSWSRQKLEFGNLFTDQAGIISLQSEIHFLVQAAFQLAHNL